MRCLEKIIIDKLENNETDLHDLMKIMPSPDFPTGGLVHNLKEMENIWLTGRGSVKLRAKWYEEETSSGNPVIIIHEIPYQVVKERFVETVHQLAKPNKNKGGKREIEEIKEFRDESDKDGLRIYIELKKDIDAELFFNKLIKLTDLEKSISYNINVLVDGQPKLVGIKEVLDNFIKHRMEVIVRRTQHLSDLAQKKAHILDALEKALTHIDEVIELIKKSSNTKEAKENLMRFLTIDEVQAQSIVDMRLNKLTSGEINDIHIERHEIKNKINFFIFILCCVY
jgi:DNA gyrase subunit A